MQDIVGQQLGNYRLIQLLGRGGYADVYLAQHVRLDSQAAIKVLHARLVNSEEVDNFQNEGRIIARLIHPHIVRVFDFDVQQDIPFMVMDYAPNGSLRKRHPKGQRVALSTLLPYVKQVADALQYAHDQHYIHRDVKPENMLLGRSGEVLLSDFGTALVSQATGYQSALQNVVGTVSYMAPEQFQGKARPASDQYALAVVVYEWLCGDVPFHGGATEVAIQHTINPPPPLREKVPSISPQVEQVLMKALAKDYHQRYPRVQDFADALEQAAASIYSDPTLAVPLRSPQPRTALSDDAYQHSPQEKPPFTAHPPVKPAPLAMDTFTSEAARAPASPMPTPPMQTVLTPPSQQWREAPSYQEPGRRGERKRHFGLIAALFLFLLALLLTVGVAWYVLPRLARNASPTPQPTVVFPNVAGSYSGTLINASADITAPMSLSIQQSGAAIQGNFVVGGQLVGSNPFNGSVDTNKHIWFTVQSYHGNAPLYFDGTVQPNGSMSGNYCSLGTDGQCSAQAGGSGTWKVSRNSGTTPTPASAGEED